MTKSRSGQDYRDKSMVYPVFPAKLVLRSGLRERGWAIRDVYLNDSLSLLCRGSSHPLDALPAYPVRPSSQSPVQDLSTQPIQERKDGVMQNGSLSREQRKRSSDVWCYRWWESGPTGRRIHRRIILGTVEQLHDRRAANQATVGLRREIITRTTSARRRR